MSGALDAIVGRIDAGDLRLRKHTVVRRLAAHLPPLSSPASDALAAFDAGKCAICPELAEKLWAEIEALPLAHQGGRRMLVYLLGPDAPLDGMDAEYLIEWSESEGLTTNEILCAFVEGQ